MKRIVGLSLGLLLMTGCGGGGGSSSGGGSVAPSAPAPSPSPTLPSTSSAAAYLVSNVNVSPPPTPYGPTNQDDGGWSQLNLPTLQQCGNGTLATDCAVWSFVEQTTSSNARSPRAARRPRVAVAGSQPPTLNFCRDSASYPVADLGSSAIPVEGMGTDTFSVTYSGTKQAPIVTFATRPWAVNVAGTFSGSATSAPAIAITPAVTGTPSRGWLLFFTWTWPADVLLIPYQVNEIQLNAASSPLAVAPKSSGRLGAFDCLAHPITATASLGTGFGFSADLKTSSVTSTGAELSVPIYTGAAPSGEAVLYDALGATVQTPVN